MSVIRIKGDEIEFEGSLDEIKKELSNKFSHRKVSASKMAEELDVTIKTLYNWAHKYDTYKSMGKRKYTIIQKMKLILAYDCLSEDEKGPFLRIKGLYDEDILNWKSEITKLDEASKTLDYSTELKLMKSDLKRTKKMLNNKCNEIRKKEKELKEAKAIIELKKKAEILFGSSDEE